MRLEFTGIGHTFGAQQILSGIDLTAKAGAITCLLGPSGCGKTTLLRLTAGLFEVQRGEIRLGDETLAAPGVHPPPEKRPVGLVFQEGALFPHLNVAKNIAFGLRPGPDREQKVADLLDQVGLAGWEKAYPHTLSGGQQQRVALARALAPEPKVLLLDEPFANVDVVLRRELREETRRVLRARDAIAVLVTHDPEEAMDIGDHIAVMGGGTIEQCGTPSTLYNAPQSAAIAALFGRGQKLRARRVGSLLKTPFGPWPDDALSTPMAQEGSIDLVVRPEALRIEDGQGATVDDIRPQGPNQQITLLAPSGERLAALVPESTAVHRGTKVKAVPLRGSIFGFPG
ncbi:MAG: ABC transporter ATP-binding protein [Pseudomonadota bacterium]